MFNKIKKGLFISLLVYLPMSSMAWGMLGHRIVGEIANSYLTKQTKKEIAKILGTESIAMTSNWPDFIKSDPAYNYLNSWHYINLKAGLTEAEVKAHFANDTSTNAFTKINWMIEQFKNKNLSQENKILYLRLLIHIIGDIHQPLHVGRPDDLGGNKVKVLWFNSPYNLHQIWDERLIDYQNLSYTEYVSSINFTTKEQRKTWQSEPMVDWFYQSYQIAEKVYGDVTQPDEKLGFAYNFKYVTTLNQQLLKAGVHLAGVLNNLFVKS